MAWVLPTNIDLVAVLNQDELEMLSQSPDFTSQTDPSTTNTLAACNHVRGYLSRLANLGYLKMHPTSGYIPEELVMTAMDIAAFAMLRRFNVPTTEERFEAYKIAKQTLKDIADKNIIPESYIDPDASQEEENNALAGMIPLFAMEFKQHILDHEDPFSP